MITWAEWNITPGGNHDEFLALTIEPWLRWLKEIDKPTSWHYFWEWGESDNRDSEVCRFRMLGTTANHESFRENLSRHEGKRVASWFEGAHGKRGEQYEGESVFYGDRVWELTYRLWHAHAELALALACQAVTGKLERPRSMHWRRTAHLTCNQLELPDIRMCLEQAQRYLFIFPQVTEGEKELSEADSRLLAALDSWLYPPESI